MSRYGTKAWRSFDPAAAGGRAPQTLRLLPTSRVRILGLDPGSRRTGYGIIDCQGGDSIHLTHGCILGSGASLGERLRTIFEGVRRLVEEHQPDEVAIERVFVNRNVDSALKLGQARGAALCAVPQPVPVFEYAPRAIKLAVVGSGGAEKPQVAHMIRVILQLQIRVVGDASDALAVAVCHANSRRLQILAESQSTARRGIAHR
jgi:crossover junction endodeoxyribonuclease RuvC